MTNQPNQIFDLGRGLTVRMSCQLTHIAKGGGLQKKRYNSFSFRALVASLLTLAVIAAIGGPAGAQDGTDELQSVMGMAPIASGRIVFNGTDISSLAPEKIARMGIGLVPQGRRLFANLTVEENLNIGALRRTGRRAQRALRPVQVSRGIRACPRRPARGGPAAVDLRDGP